MNLSSDTPRRLAAVLLLLTGLYVYGCGTPDDLLRRPVEIDMSRRAFPDAEGWGAWSRGGRGGAVIYVTNLDDSGSGSLRAALETAGPRTIVFAVSGLIQLKTDLHISSPYVTIAGQTAPGDGITLKNAGIYIRTHDVIIRHLRIRPGDSPTGSSAHDRDAVTVGEDSYSVIVDHVSASWAIDEIMSTWYAPQYITFQNCLLSEALHDSAIRAEDHSKALLIGDNSYRVSVLRNVFAHNDDRSPACVKGGAVCDIVNNLVYNWGSVAFSFSADYVKEGAEVNLLSNEFDAGPSSLPDSFFTEASTDYGSRIFIDDGNIGDDGLLGSFNAARDSFIESKSYLVDRPVNGPVDVSVSDMAAIRSALLDNAGATLPRRDVVDIRIIGEIISGTGAVIDSPADVGGYPDFVPVILADSELDAHDADRDGMADIWETGRGLDPADPSDRNLDTDGDGYTNLEEYLNSL